jgi:two-component system, NtrC family, response regulator HydG
LLVNHFVERLNHYYNKKVLEVSRDVMKILQNYLWPGNVRELENTIEHTYVLTTASILEVHTLPLDIQHFGIAEQMTPPQLIDLNEDEERIRKAQFSSDGNLEKAASLLQIHRSTLWRKMKEFRIAKGFGKISNT